MVKNVCFYEADISQEIFFDEADIDGTPPNKEERSYTVHLAINTGEGLEAIPATFQQIEFAARHMMASANERDETLKQRPHKAGVLRIKNLRHKGFGADFGS